MIGIIATCLLALNPLASTGNENGMWFVGDQDPTVLNFDSKTRGLDYSICARVSKDSYTILQKLGHRPVDMTVFDSAIWFVDYSSNIALYSIQKTSRPSSAVVKASLQSILETETAPTDLISLDDSIAVACGGQTLQVHTFDGYTWKELPILIVPNARIANHNGTLVAVAPHELGIMLWTYSNNQWVAGTVLNVRGTLYEVLTKNEWLLFVSTESEQSHIVGLQGTTPIEIASFDIPKGGWSVVSSPEGISVVGVQRNGTISVLDIGWPSGKYHEEVVLHQDMSNGLSFIDRFPFLFPALFVLFLFLLMSRRARAKRLKKEG